MARIFDLESGEDLEKRLSALEVEEESDFASQVIRSTLDGILAYDRDCRYTLFNPAMERLTGMKREQVIGRVAFEVFPFLKDVGTDQYFYAALRGETHIETEGVYDVPSTGRRGFVHRCHMPLKNEAGEVVGGLAVVRDVTDSVRAMHQLKRLNETLEARVKDRTRELEAAVASLQFLADVGAALAACIDRDCVVDTLGRMSARYFEGWCRVHLVDGDRLGRGKVFHESAESARIYQAIEDDFPPNPEAALGPYSVLRSAQPIWSSQVPESHFRDFCQNDEHAERVRALGFRSSICVPLVGRDRVWGVVTLLTGTRSYTPADLQVALDLGARVGLALDGVSRLEWVRRSARR